MKALVLLLCWLALGIAEARGSVFAKRFIVSAANPLAAQAGA